MLSHFYFFVSCQSFLTQLSHHVMLSSDIWKHRMNKLRTASLLLLLFSVAQGRLSKTINLLSKDSGQEIKSYRFWGGQFMASFGNSCSVCYNPNPVSDTLLYVPQVYSVCWLSSMCRNTYLPSPHTITKSLASSWVGQHISKVITDSSVPVDPNIIFSEFPI